MCCAVLSTILCTIKNLWSHSIKVGNIPDFLLSSVVILPWSDNCAESDVKQYCLTLLRDKFLLRFTRSKSDHIQVRKWLTNTACCIIDTGAKKKIMISSISLVENRDAVILHALHTLQKEYNYNQWLLYSWLQRLALYGEVLLLMGDLNYTWGCQRGERPSGNLRYNGDQPHAIHTRPALDLDPLIHTVFWIPYRLSSGSLQTVLLIISQWESTLLWCRTAGCRGMLPVKHDKPLPHRNTNHLDCVHILAVDDLYNLFSRVSSMLCI